MQRDKKYLKTSKFANYRLNTPNNENCKQNFKNMGPENRNSTMPSFTA